MKRTENKFRITSKKQTFGQTYMEFDGYHGNVKNDGQAVDITKLPERMMKQPLKISAP